MPSANSEAFAFLQTRRSRPAKTLVSPTPNHEELMQLLNCAARCPDHGKLEPWRFIVIKQPAMARLAQIAQDRGEALGLDPQQVQKGRNQFDQGLLAVAVIEVNKPSPKVPQLEQTYSAGAVCLSLLNAALAAGWGANWLSGWPSHDREFMKTAFDLNAHERIAGFIHIASQSVTPPERPRPDVDAMTTWISQ